MPHKNTRKKHRPNQRPHSHDLYITVFTGPAPSTPKHKVSKQTTATEQAVIQQTFDPRTMCTHPQVIYNAETGEYVCTQCGLVLNVDNIAVHESDYKATNPTIIYRESLGELKARQVELDKTIDLIIGLDWQSIKKRRPQHHYKVAFLPRGEEEEY